MYNCTLDSLRGYAFKLPNSIINAPNFMGGGIIMPLANSLQFFDGAKTQTIYEGRREVSAVEMRGPFLGVGERASPGQLISAVLLDSRELGGRQVFNYQKSEITHIAVSAGGEFICSVGRSSELVEELVVIETGGQSEVGTKVFFAKSFRRSEGRVMALRFSNRDPHFFVLLCTNKVLFFRIDPDSGAVEESLARVSRVREYTNFIFSPDDTALYCCSKNGDVSEISVEEGKVNVTQEMRVGPRRRVITKGINNLKWVEPNHLVIVGKEGLLGLIDVEDMRLVKESKLQEDEIISISEFEKGKAFIATSRAVIYSLTASTLAVELFYTCCSTKINALAFLKGYSDIFGTSSGGEIIVWKTKTLTPALRISLPRLTCLALHFPKNGRYIVSGWSDDCIRIFSPNNGKLVHRIAPCNLGKVTDIISDEDSTQILCGGANGVIRLWNLVEAKIFGIVLGALAFHNQPVNCLRINPWKAEEMVSCCEDGAYALWNLGKFELRSWFRVCNFLKEVEFMDELRIRLVGSGNVIYECFACDGVAKKTTEVTGSYINTLAECYIEATGEKLLFYGGDCPQLSYFDVGEKNVTLYKMESYGEISRVGLTSNKKNIIAVTTNGIIISYSIFAIKQVLREDE